MANPKNGATPRLKAVPQSIGGHQPPSAAVLDRIGSTIALTMMNEMRSTRAVLSESIDVLPRGDDTYRERLEQNVWLATAMIERWHLFLDEIQVRIYPHGGRQGEFDIGKYFDQGGPWHE